MTTGTRQANAGMSPLATAQSPASASAAVSWLVPLALLLAVMALFHIVTLRAGHSWPDDFALYIMHARNLVEGRPYADTGFIYNPEDPWYSPPVYPPGFPLLLAPVYALFGPNLFVMRLIVIGSLVATADLVAMLARPALSPRLALAVVALVGFQPFFADFKNQLLPDFTFTFVALFSLLLLRRLHESSAPPRAPTKRDLGLAVLAGACIHAAISLRIVGLALFAALGLYHLYQLIRGVWPSLAILVCVATALLFDAIELAMLPHAIGGYTAQIGDIGSAAPDVSLFTLPLGRIWNLFAHTDVLWYGPVFAVTAFLMSAAALLGLVGFTRRLVQPSIVEAFAIAYSATIVATGVGDARYLIPIMPLLLYYAVLGAVYLTERWGGVVRVTALALAAVVAVSYAVALLGLPRGAYARGVTGEPAMELYAWIERCTAADDRLVTSRPRAMALYSGRPAIRVRRHIETERFGDIVQAAGGAWVIAHRGDQVDSLSSASARHTRAFQNHQFNVYRFGPDPATRPADCARASTSASVSTDRSRE